MGPPMCIWKGKECTKDLIPSNVRYLCLWLAQANTILRLLFKTWYAPQTMCTKSPLVHRTRPEVLLKKGLGLHTRVRAQDWPITRVCLHGTIRSGALIVNSSCTISDLTEEVMATSLQGLLITGLGPLQH